MAHNNSPKERWRKQLERKTERRASYDRILIVSEGSKTEPKYFKEICRYYNLVTANVHICPSSGTDPLSVVKYAEKLFTKGNYKNIQPRAFEQVYAVFDRDEHHTYFEAIKEAGLLDSKLHNDNKRRVKFAAIPSIPSFEIWLLLHFKDVLAPLHRTDAFDQVKNYIQNYEKGVDGIFKATYEHLNLACKRAEKLAKSNSVFNGEGPYTAINNLVKLLVDLKKQKKKD